MSVSASKVNTRLIIMAKTFCAPFCPTLSARLCSVSIIKTLESEVPLPPRSPKGQRPKLQYSVVALLDQHARGFLWPWPRNGETVGTIRDPEGCQYHVCRVAIEDIGVNLVESIDREWCVYSYSIVSCFRPECDTRRYFDRSKLAAPF